MFPGGVQRLHVFALVSSLCLVLSRAQLEELGKPCSRSFECWRTEPVDADGQPLSLAHLHDSSEGGRAKRLEVGGSQSRGGRCRCTEGVCQFFLIPSSSFVPCEEF